MRPSIALVLAGALAGSQQAAAYPIFGKANQPCTVWNIGKSDKVSRLGQVAYVSGYLSALNIASHSNQTGESDVASTIAEIDRICAKREFRDRKVADVLNIITSVMLTDAIVDGRMPNWTP